ncbi:WD40-repeat-containing domain protein [Gorgonomyces haynaldii]|nr:WD40-repeat-containing domain protein [Gorgonomyces haynaldii]
MESVHSQPITIESLKTTVVKKANESVKSDAKESTSESTRADSINMDSFTMAELQQDLGLDSPPDDTVEIPEVFDIKPVILSVHTMIGHSDAVWEMKIHSNGKLLASASADGSVRIWDISNPHTCTIKSTIWYNGFSTGQSGQFVSGTQTPVCLSWYQDLLYVGFKQGGVGVYDIQGQQVKQHLISDTGVLSILALDAVLYCGYESGKLVMYDRSNLEQVLHQSHDAGIESLCSSRGTVVARGISID